LGEVFSVALENMIRRNAHLIGDIPLVGAGLAGIVEQDNKRLEETAQNSTQAIEERKVSFQKVPEKDKSSSYTAISKEDQGTLDYFKQLRQAFTEEELLQVIDIINALSYNKENIASVLELLEEDDEKEDDNTLNNSDNSSHEGSSNNSSRSDSREDVDEQELSHQL